MKRKIPLFLLGLAMLYLGFTSYHDQLMGAIFVLFGFAACLLTIMAKKSDESGE